MTLPLPRDDIFRYLPDHRILLCIPCGYAVPPQAITPHLQRNEHHDLSRKDRQALRAYALAHDLPKPEDVPVPSAGVMPIPRLRLSSGYACGLCNHLTTSVNNLKDHGRQQHNKRKGDGVYWREVKLQTFFRGGHLRYFIVSSAGRTIPETTIPSEASRSSIHGDENSEFGIKEKPGSTNHIEVSVAIGGPVNAPKHSTLVQEGLGVGPPEGFHKPPNHSITGKRDPESNVMTFQPSLEEFRDFPKFLTGALAASRAGSGPHAGVCVVKVPQGGLSSSRPVGVFRSRNSKCLQYFEQTSRVPDLNNSGVFRINHVTKGPATIAQWQKLVDGVAKEHGNIVGDGRMNDLLSQEGLKAVYVSNTAAKSISSLFALDPIGLSELPGNQLQHLEIPGMSSDYIYLGTPGSLFTMHLEDYNVHSFNYLKSGEPKRWVVINPGSRTKFESLIKAIFPTIPTTCSQFMRHQNLYISPNFLRQHSIGFAEVTQTPGDMLVLFPFAYHQGYNMGENIALASNYALESEEPLYERNYTPCGGECCPGLVPLVLRFPLRLQTKEMFQVVVPGKKRKVGSEKDGVELAAPRKRGRPRKTKTNLEGHGGGTLTTPKHKIPKTTKPPQASSGDIFSVLSPPAARKRGRPPKAKTDESIAPRRGRPKKANIPDMDDGRALAASGAPTELYASATPTPPNGGGPTIKILEIAAPPTESAVPETIDADSEPATTSEVTALARGGSTMARTPEISNVPAIPQPYTAPMVPNELAMPNVAITSNEPAMTSHPSEVNLPATPNSPITINLSTGPSNITDLNVPAAPDDTTAIKSIINTLVGPNKITQPSCF